MVEANNEEAIGFWQSFFGLLLISFIITGVFFSIFWYFFGTVLTNSNHSQYAQDFLSILGSIFTVVGYLLTIYQVSELRSRQETISSTRKEMKTESFKLNSFRDIEKAQKTLQDLVNEVEGVEKFSDKVLRGFIDKLQHIKEKLVEIDADKEILDGLKPCENCQKLTDNAINSFRKVITDNKIDETNRLFHKFEIKAIIEELIKVNSQIKN